MPTGPLLWVHFPLLKVQICIPGPLNNSFLSSTSFSPWTLLLFYHKFYLGIKLMSKQKCGYFSSLSPSQTNSGRNVLKLNLVKPNSKESKSLWKMILNKKKKKAVWFLLFILQDTSKSNWLYITSLSVGVLFEGKLNIQGLIKSDFTVLI